MNNPRFTLSVYVFGRGHEELGIYPCADARSAFRFRMGTAKLRIKAPYTDYADSRDWWA